MQVHYGTDNLHFVNPVVTIGSFDGVHKGHVQVIESLKHIAHELAGESVIISFEPHPREVLYPLEKPPGILTTLKEKTEILSSYGIDHLVILRFTPHLASLPYESFVKQVLIEGIGMKGLVVGYDHRFGRNREGSFESLKQLAEKYHFYLEQEQAYEENQINVSSTKIRTALELGDIALVTEFLGHPYSFTGRVVQGDKIGRKMGFPTANIAINDHRKLLPACGVYAVRVCVKEKMYNGMLNIGVRPTVSSCGIIRLEVNIFDFGENIYGESIRVELLCRIRGERKFNSIDELSRQLQQDKETACRFITSCQS